MNLGFVKVMFGETSALYLDGKLVFYGDAYHHKINERIEGYVKGYTDALVLENTFESHKCIDEELNQKIEELGEFPPQYLNEIKNG